VDFFALTNPSPWPGLNPQPLGPVASTLTTTPPRRLLVNGLLTGIAILLSVNFRLSSNITIQYMWLYYNLKTFLKFIHVCFQVREEEKSQRQDLFILATSYSGQLKAKSASMIRENDFHQVSDKVTLLLALLSLF
jgi:hypothetical protein